MAKRVGITGGMGCGKSTVLAEFEHLGVPCFLADQAGADLYSQPSFLSDVRQLLGASVFNPDGTADKQAIARRVFANSAELDGLNRLVHPKVMQAFEAFCLQHADSPYVMFESAILYDYGFDRMMDAVVCVYLDLEERVARLLKRDGSSRQAIMARINRQMPAEQAMMRADYVILNYEGNPRSRQVAYIDSVLRQ